MIVSPVFVSWYKYGCLVCESFSVVTLPFPFLVVFYYGTIKPEMLLVVICMLLGSLLLRTDKLLVC